MTRRHIGGLLWVGIGAITCACGSNGGAPARSASAGPSAVVSASTTLPPSARSTTVALPPPPTSAAPFVASSETPDDVRAIAKRRAVDDGKIPPSTLEEYRCGDLECMHISNGYTSDQWCFRNGSVVGRAHGTDYGADNSAGGELPDFRTCTRKSPTK